MLFQISGDSTDGPIESTPSSTKVPLQCKIQKLKEYGNFTWDMVLRDVHRDMVTQALLENSAMTIKEMRKKFIQSFPDFGMISMTAIYNLMKKSKKLLPQEVSLEGNSNNAWNQQTIPLHTLSEAGNIKNCSDEILTNGQKKFILDSIIANPEITIAQMKQKFVESYPEIDITNPGIYKQIARNKHLISPQIDTYFQINSNFSWRKFLNKSHKQFCMEIFDLDDKITIKDMRQAFIKKFPNCLQIPKSSIYWLMKESRKAIARRNNRKKKQQLTKLVSQKNKHLQVASESENSLVPSFELNLKLLKVIEVSSFLIFLLLSISFF